MEYFRFKLLYFILFSGLGILMPYLPVFFESLHLSKSEIGILSMMPNFGSFLVAPLFSMLGDMLQAHYELMILSLILSTVCTLAMLSVSSFTPMACIVMLASICRAPLQPQVDSLVISSLADKGKYGDMRLWGAISFGVFSFLGGLLASTPTPSSTTTAATTATGSFKYIFFLHAFFFLCSGYVLLSIVYEQTRQVQSQAQTQARARSGGEDSTRSNSNVRS
jgi:MFS family permease